MKIISELEAKNFGSFAEKAEAERRRFLDDGGTWSLGANWTLSFLAPLAGLEASLYYASIDEKYLARFKEIILFLCGVREELAELVKNGGARQQVKWAEDNCYSLDPDDFPVMETMFSFLSILKALYFTGTDFLTEAERERVEKLCRAEISVVFVDRQWGRHNRAALRAIALLYFARAFPGHRDAETALRYSRELISESAGCYSIEDAGGYLAIWLTCVSEYVQFENLWDFRAEQTLGYYARFFAASLMPNGGVPEFGDSRFDTQDAVSYLSVIELVAARRRDGALAYAAAKIHRHITEDMTLSASSMAERGLFNSYLWADGSVAPVEYPEKSAELLDEDIGKKMVFRGGDRIYLLYNYRDMPKSGFLTRRYLINTIPVHAEKPHHGHADEQSIIALCEGKNVFLRDGGYRDKFTTDGHYRADFYHNRLVIRNGRVLNETGFLEYARNIGTFLPVETERVFLQDFSFATVIRTRLYDRFRKADADRHIIHLKNENIFIVADAVRAREASELTAGVMYHAEKIEKLTETDYKITGEPGGGMIISFGVNDRLFSLETQRRNYRDETALSQYISKFFRAGEYISFVSVLRPGAEKTGGTASGFAVKEFNGGENICVEIEAGGKKYTIGVKNNEERGVTDAHRRPSYDYGAGKAAYGEFETDALFFISDGVSYGAVDFTEIYRNGEAVFKTPKTVFYQLDFINFVRARGAWGFHEGELR